MTPTLTFVKTIDSSVITELLSLQYAVTDINDYLGTCNVEND